MGMAIGQVWPSFGQSDPVVGLVGRFKLLDLEVNGIVSQRIRHVIKRFLKRVGFTHVETRHAQDVSPFTLRFIVEGKAGAPVRPDQLAKLKYLNESVIYVLAGGDSGAVPHPSQADAELLRRLLAKVEPRLNKVYYTRA